MSGETIGKHEHQDWEITYEDIEDPSEKKGIHLQTYVCRVCGMKFVLKKLGPSPTTNED